jgi:ketosteroid isomerase-like protein
MRRIILLAVFTLAIPALNFAQANASADKKQPAGQEGVEQAIMKLDRELTDAVVKNDRAAVNRVELDNHVFINPGGGIEEKAQTTGPGPTFESLDTSDVVVRVTGDTAVLTGRAMVKGHLASGADISGPYRYMRVFVKQKGQWRVAATTAVPISPAPTSTPAPKS